MNAKTYLLQISLINAKLKMIEANILKIRAELQSLGDVSLSSSWGGDYLATIPLDEDETYTEVLMYHNGRFYEDDDEWGETYHDDVIAWMPLPEPYKGGADMRNNKGD